MPSEDVIVFLRAQTGEFQGKMRQAAGETEKFGSRSKQAFDKTAAIGKGALLGIAGAALAVGAKSLAAAETFEKSHARLVNAIENTGSSFDAQKKAIDAVEKSGEGLGYSNAQIEESLAVMTRGMGSSSKAIGYLGIAQDLAAAKGISLSDAALAVTKASEGQLRPLKQLGIDLPVAAGGALKTKVAFEKMVVAQQKLRDVQEKIRTGILKGNAAHAALAKALGVVDTAQKKFNATSTAGGSIMAALGAKLSGSAAAQADTFGGKIAALKAEAEDLFKNIGMKLIPIIEMLVGKIMLAAKWFEQHQAVAKALAIVFGGALAVAIAAYIASMVAAAAATVAATWPILVIAAALAALVVAVVYAWNHWKAFRDVVSSAVDNTKNAVVKFVQFVQALWTRFGDTILSYAQSTWNNIREYIDGVINVVRGIIKVVTSLIRGDWSGAWNGIKQVLYGVWEGIKSTVALAANALRLLLAIVWIAVKNDVHRAWDAIVSFFKGLPGRIGSAFTGLAHTLAQPFIDAFNTVVDVYNNTLGRILPSLSHFNWPTPAAPKQDPHRYDVPIPPSYSHRYDVPIPRRRTGPFGGPRAAGGPVMAGLTYLVGEHGPEMFVPRGSGSITPNNALGAAQLQPIHITLEFDGKIFARAMVDQSNRQGGLPIRIRVPS